MDDSIARAQVDENVPKLKSPLMAAALSVGGAATGYGLMLLAVIPSGHIEDWQYASMLVGVSMALTGPSAGHLYTGHYGRAVAFSMARIVLFTTFFVGLTEELGHEDARANGSYREDNSWLIWGGLGGTAVLTVWEMVQSYFSAESVNQRHRAMLAVSPFLARAPTPGTRPATGLAVVGTF
jgi:hypothetical protein